ncbi:hypothetical protein [Pseudomonas aeruginosa]|uniref:hypothetical protein n=1 Tax=Pseudomonas aeruginosa TaxID=287 RepID=UPI000711061F|nr:hypothetical protein [Pseudomonas aeruginosa]
MSDVLRFDSVLMSDVYESKNGEYVQYTDYAKLEAEAQALREEVEAANERADTLEHRMMGMMTRHFAEAWRKRDTEKALDGYLSAGIAELEQERNAALAEVAALRARVVVVAPERKAVPEYASQPMTHCGATGWNACLDELARLNGKAVSEGLLRENAQAINDLVWAIQARPYCQKGLVAQCRCSSCAVEKGIQVRKQISALLGEGKEEGDVLVRE